MRKTTSCVFAIHLLFSAACVRSTDNADAVAFPFSLVDNRPFIDATVNGHGPLKMILDTGGRLLITPAVAETLELTLTDPYPLGGAGAGTETAYKATVDALEVGPAAFGAMPGDVLPLSDIQDAIGFKQWDGVVGAEIFERYVVELDFAASTMRLIEPDDFVPRAGAVVLPLTIDDGYPFVDATIAGVPGRYLVDTGDRSSLSFCSSFSAKHGLAERYDASEPMLTGWGVGGPIEAPVALVNDFDIGPFKVDGVLARFPHLTTGLFGDSELAGSIGAGFLKRFRVTFDDRGSRLILEPEAQLRQKDAVDRSGMWVGRRDGKATILHVTSSSPAADAGLRVGDQVIAVDGVASEGVDLIELRERLKEPGRSDITVDVAREGGQTLEARIQLRG